MSVIDRAHRLVLILMVVAISAIFLVDMIIELTQGVFRMSPVMNFYICLLGIAGYQIARKRWQADWLIAAGGAGTAIMGVLSYLGRDTLMDVSTGAVLVPIFGLAAIAISRRARIAIGSTLGAGAVVLTAFTLIESGHRPDDVTTKSVAVAFGFAMVGMLLSKLRTAYERQYAAREQFVASVGHELRTPLTALAGFAELLSDDGPDAEAAAVIRNQAHEAVAIVEDLLVAARFESGQIALTTSAIDVSPEIDEVVMSLATDKSIESLVLPIYVDADALRLRQIVRNLVTNAIRHGGDHITVRSFSAGRYCHIEVADDGVGFDAAEVETVFAPYGRSQHTDMGTGSIGLGLTVSRHLARLMGGDLVAEREEGFTTFRLSLPLVEVALAASSGGQRFVADAGNAPSNT